MRDDARLGMAVVLGPDATVEQVQSVADTVRDLGFNVEQVVPLANAVYGSGPRVLMSQIQALPDVVQVRETTTYQLPDFDPSIPQ